MYLYMYANISRQKRFFAFPVFLYMKSLSLDYISMTQHTLSVVPWIYLWMTFKIILLHLKRTSQFSHPSFWKIFKAFSKKKTSLDILKLLNYFGFDIIRFFYWLNLTWILIIHMSSRNILIMNEQLWEKILKICLDLLGKTHV